MKLLAVFLCIVLLGTAFALASPQTQQQRQAQQKQVQQRQAQQNQTQQKQAQAAQQRQAQQKQAQQKQAQQKQAQQKQAAAKQPPQAGKQANNASQAKAAAARLQNGNDFCQQAGFGKGKLSDGTQKKVASCSQTVQGVLPDFNKMVSTMIIAPPNGARLPRGKDIKFQVATQNLQLGFFEDPATRYYLSPQTVNGQGVIEGHQHVVVQKLPDGNQPPSATQFQFFKGLQDPSANGVLTTTLSGAKMTQPGNYRICTITGTRTHQPVIMPVAQRGSQDDCIRIQLA